MIGSEGTLGFISEITYFTVEEHAHKASALILFDHLETACSAVTPAQAHAGGGGRTARPRVAALGAGQAGHAGGAARAAGRRRGVAGRDARRDAGRAVAQDRRRSRSRSTALHAGHAAALHHRRGRIGGAVERAQGHVPGHRRDAADRHHGDHRGRGVPGRAAGRGDAGPAATAAAARLPRGHHLRPRARRQPALRLHAGLRQRGRGRALQPLHGRGVRAWWCTSTTAR